MADILPPTGLLLQNFPSATHALSPARSPPQAIHIRLSPQQLRDLRRAAGSDKKPELIFGSRQFLRFNDEKVALNVAPSTFHTELFSDTGDSAALVSHRAAIEQLAHETGKANAAAELLKARMREHEQQRSAEQLSVVNNVRFGRQGNVKSAAFTGSSSTAPKPTSSLSIPSGSQSSAQGPAQKFVLFHLLALGPASETSLQRKTNIPRDDLLALLHKHANQENGQYELDKKYYKELDVWSFPYPGDSRQQAIDNAIHAFDRQRISKTDKVWDVLNKPSDRGKGICLSKLHLDPAKAIPSDHRKLLGAAAATVGGSSPQAMSSQSSPNLKATKKPTERELQTKRLLSKNPGKAAMKAIDSKATSKASQKSTDAPRNKPGPKKAEAKSSVTQKRKSGPQPLSADVVVDSDEEAAEAERDIQAKKQRVNNDTVKPVGKPATARTKAAPPPVKADKPAPPPVQKAKLTQRSPAKSPLALTIKKKTASAPAPAPAPALASKHERTLSSLSKTASISHKRSDASPCIAPSSSTSQNNSYVSNWVGSLDQASKPARRLSGSGNSLTSSASSMKRTSSSDGEPAAKRVKPSQSHAPFASSPLTSVASSDSIEKAETTHARARLPDLPPKHIGSSASSPASPRSMTLSELNSLRSTVFAELLQLRMKADKLGKPDSGLKARIAEKFDMYDYLSGEVASREGKSKKEVPIPCDIKFPSDCSAFLGKEYDAKLQDYSALHSRVSKQTRPSAADKTSLWTLHNELHGLAQLQKAAVEKEQRAKLDANLTGGSRSVSSSTSAVGANLNREQTLKEYGKYHRLYNAWCSFRAQLRADASYPKLPAAKIKEDREMFSKLSEMQTELIANFESMRKLLSRPNRGMAKTASGAVPNRTETELLAWKTKTKMKDWADEYERMLAEFGQWTPKEMENLWRTQEQLHKDRRAACRAVALEFGAKDEARIEEISLEDVIERISRKG